MKFTGTLPTASENVSTIFCNLVKQRMGGFDNGHWDFPEQMGGHSGFIYVIYDSVMKKCYLGKKSFIARKLGKELESDWRKYTSSSKLLKVLLKERPKEEFEFICLEQYKTRGTLSYSETWSLCFVEAPTNSRFYNTLIEKVSWPVKEKITDRHKERLDKVLERLHD